MESQENRLDNLRNEIIEELNPIIEEKIEEKIKNNLQNENSQPENPEIAETAVSATAASEDLAAVGQKVDALITLVEELSYKDKINKELHEELQQYRLGLRKSFISPLLKGIIREYDRVDRQYRLFKRKGYDENTQAAELLREFQIVSMALLDLLSDYSIEPFTVNAGDAHSTKEHKIVEIIEPSDAAQAGTVASCETCGFRDIETGLLVRAAEVIIYKKNNS